MDRLSRATLTLAAEASAQGALVFFEPSGKSTEKLMAEAIALAHIVKYSDQRLTGIEGLMADGSATLLEIQTIGNLGLNYRHRLDDGLSDWMRLDAVPAPRLSDTCGSGDWCTAGFIAKATAEGQKGLHRMGSGGLQSALRYGQALAAWNCGFEGARGGMYAVEATDFAFQIDQLLKGQFNVPLAGLTKVGFGQPIGCPACLHASSMDSDTLSGSTSPIA